MAGYLKVSHAYVRGIGWLEFGRRDGESTTGMAKFIKSLRLRLWSYNSYRSSINLEKLREI